MIKKIQILYSLFILITFLIICGVPLVSADNQTFVPDTVGVKPVIVANYVVPNQIPIPGAPPKLSPEEEAKMQEIMREQDRINELRKANRTFWQRKLSSQLLSLLESDSYIKTGKISEQDMKSIMTSSTVIPSDQVFQKFGISKPTGDLFLVELRINKSASTYNVYPYVASVSGTIGHTIYCWVELSSLQDIASLEPVIQIGLAYKPGLDVYVAGNPITNQALPGKNLGDTKEETSPIRAHTDTFVTPIGTPPPSTENGNNSSHVAVTGTTPASPLSAIGTGLTAVATAIIVLQNKRREMNFGSKKKSGEKLC
ncbi:MAG: hypothetical protein STSR0009_28670 [Methanoregula sp.]